MTFSLSDFPKFLLLQTLKVILYHLIHKVKTTSTNVQNSKCDLATFYLWSIYCNAIHILVDVNSSNSSVLNPLYIIL